MGYVPAYGDNGNGRNVACSKPTLHCRKRTWEGQYKCLTRSASDAKHMVLYEWTTIINSYYFTFLEILSESYNREADKEKNRTFKWKCQGCRVKKERLEDHESNKDGIPPIIASSKPFIHEEWKHFSHLPPGRQHG